jgi:hypothetical protein
MRTCPRYTIAFLPVLLLTRTPASLLFLSLGLCLPAAVDVDADAPNPEIMMFTDFAKSGLVLKAWSM